VLFKAGRAYPIDFEDSGFGFWMWDIAVALCQWAWGSEWERMRDAFHEGYSRIRILPGDQWSKLDLFVAIQFATMLLWFTEFLINDPKRAVEHGPLRNFNGDKLLEYISR
jgi:Ser/Thr protein kinase RdoA (MazF antagonist)